MDVCIVNCLLRGNTCLVVLIVVHKLTLVDADIIWLEHDLLAALKRWLSDQFLLCPAASGLSPNMPKWLLCMAASDIRYGNESSAVDNTTE